MYRIACLIFALVIAGCSGDEPASPAPPVDPANPVEPTPADSAALTTPPASYTRTVPGSWSTRRTGNETVFHIVVAQAGTWIYGGTQYGSWQPIADVRLAENGTKIWIDLTPAPWPANAWRFCGTIAGDSCVGWDRLYVCNPGHEFDRSRPFSTGPRTLYRK